MKQPLVSIIIVNLNGEKHLETCLNSLKTVEDVLFELIIVDNGSYDNSINVIKKFFSKAKIIRNKKNLGFAKPNNQGANIAHGEFLLLLNNDTKLTRNFLKGLVLAMKDKSVGACQPKILLMSDNKRVDCIGSFLTNTGFLYHFGFHKIDNPLYNRTLNIFSPRGACMLIRRKLFEDLGGFDEDFFAYFEETDLCWRIWLVGKKVAYLPQYVVYHQRGGTSSHMDNSFIQYHSFKNRICTLIKNLSFSKLFYIMPVHLVFCIVAIFAYLILGKVKNSIAILQALWWNVVNLKSILVKRKAIQDKRKISDDNLWPVIAKKIPMKYFLYLFLGLEKYQDEH